MSLQTRFFFLSITYRYFKMKFVYSSLSFKCSPYFLCAPYLHILLLTDVSQLHRRYIFRIFTVSYVFRTVFRRVNKGKWEGNCALRILSGAKILDKHKQSEAEVQDKLPLSLYTHVQKIREFFSFLSLELFFQWVLVPILAIFSQ